MSDKKVSAVRLCEGRVRVEQVNTTGPQSSSSIIDTMTVAEAHALMDELYNVLKDPTDPSVYKYIDPMNQDGDTWTSDVNDRFTWCNVSHDDWICSLHKEHTNPESEYYYPWHLAGGDPHIVYDSWPIT